MLQCWNHQRLSSSSTRDHECESVVRGVRSIKLPMRRLWANVVFLPPSARLSAVGKDILFRRYALKMPPRQEFILAPVTPRQRLNISCLLPRRAYLLRLNFIALSNPTLLDRKRRSFSTTAFRSQDVFHAQKENPSSASFLSSLESSPKIPQTLTEKIVQRHSVGLPKGKIVKSGDYVTLSPYRCMTHDNSWPVVKKFKSIGASKIYDKNQIVITLDHDVQNKSEANLTKYRQIEDFAKQQGVVFYPAGWGIGHQIMIEEGWAYPSSLVVASDSHSNMYVTLPFFTCCSF